MYFFIDPVNLTNQNDYDSYGPVSIIQNADGTQSSVNPALKYNVTSKFMLTNETKAFACESGLMIVQQSDEDDTLVNIVIKPINNISGIPLNVEYYVYRGILKDSLIFDDGVTCTIQTYNPTTSNDLVSRIRQDINTNDYSCEQIGYNNDVDSLTLLDSVFTENNPVTGPVQISAITVLEGEWIGTFTNTHNIGFEIVLKSDFNDFDIGFLRAVSHEIDVTDLTGFEERLRREEILKFIDPAAFFGMHHSQTVDYYSNGATNDTETTTSNSTGAGNNRFIYTRLLENFHTKNNVYIDIRSEKGYSYNFYQNYKVNNTDLNNVQLRTQSGNAPLNAQEYHTDQWPILILTATHTTGSENSLKLSLRIDDNTMPILYTQTSLTKDRGGNATRIASRYFNTTHLIDDGNNPNHTTWTNMFRILFPNTQYGAGGNSNRDYISNYVRLNYYRTKHNFTNTNASVLENIHYYDSAFCSIDIPEFSLPDNLSVGHIESADPIYVREPLHYDANHPSYDANYDVEGTGNFEMNMINGAYWGDGRVLMYTRIEYVDYQTGIVNGRRRVIADKTSGKEYLNTFDQQLSSFTSNNKYTALANDRLKFICREYDITGNINDTKIPSINFFRSSDLGDSGMNHKENCMLLGLTIDEMVSIKSDTQLSENHKRFIHLEPLAGNPQQDNNNNGYFAYTLRLQGFDANQHADIITPQHNGNDIVVYSRDNQFFSSYAFSENETVTSLQNGTALTNRIEFRIYHDGIVKITDNVDFALALVYNQERVHYVYYNAQNNTSEIQGLAQGAANAANGLELVTANKMEKQRGTLAAVPNGFVQFINYANENVPGVDATRSHENNEGDIVTEGSFNIRRYNNLGKKAFMVRVVTESITTMSGNVTTVTNYFRDTNIGFDLEFENTLRLYSSPPLAAAVLGALIRVNQNVISEGFAYIKGSCYPSSQHVNGQAFDSTYSFIPANDQNFINALNFFGFTLHYIGDEPYHYNNLNNLPNTTPDIWWNLHDGHLHSQDLELNDGNKVL